MQPWHDEVTMAVSRLDPDNVLPPLSSRSHVMKRSKIVVMNQGQKLL